MSQASPKPILTPFLKRAGRLNQVRMNICMIGSRFEGQHDMHLYTNNSWDRDVVLRQQEYSFSGFSHSTMDRRASNRLYASVIPSAQTWGNALYLLDLVSKNWLPSQW